MEAGTLGGLKSADLLPDGIAYVLNVFIADTSSLKNRALLFAFSTSPYIATTFAGPAMAQSFYEHSKWQWGFGSFAMITPLVCLPFVLVFGYNQREAIRQGILIKHKEASGRNWWQSILHHLIDFDGKSSRAWELGSFTCTD